RPSLVTLDRTLKLELCEVVADQAHIARKREADVVNFHEEILPDLSWIADVDALIADITIRLRSTEHRDTRERTAVILKLERLVVTGHVQKLHRSKPRVDVVLARRHRRRC